MIHNETDLNLASFLITRGLNLIKVKAIHKSRPTRFTFVFDSPGSKETESLIKEYSGVNPKVNIKEFLKNRRQLLNFINSGKDKP